MRLLATAGGEGRNGAGKSGEQAVRIHRKGSAHISHAARCRSDERNRTKNEITPLPGACRQYAGRPRAAHFCEKATATAAGFFVSLREARKQ